MRSHSTQCAVKAHSAQPQHTVRSHSTQSQHLEHDDPVRDGHQVALQVLQRDVILLHVPGTRCTQNRGEGGAGVRFCVTDESFMDRRDMHGWGIASDRKHLCCHQHPIITQHAWVLSRVYQTQHRHSTDTAQTHHRHSTDTAQTQHRHSTDTAHSIGMWAPISTNTKP